MTGALPSCRWVLRERRCREPCPAFSRDGNLRHRSIETRPEGEHRGSCFDGYLVSVGGVAPGCCRQKAERLVERSIQGIDLDVTIAGQRYGFEVKTCEDDEIRLGAKDHEGLKRQIAEGAEPYLVVLGGGLLAEWAFVRYHPGELPTGKNLSVFRLRPYRNRELERRVRAAFEQTVERHATTAIYDRQLGLDKLLDAYPARQRA